jgi:adenine-specific DNA-methyltransferase
MMVARLFRDEHPRPGDRLLDPGCGEGAFISAVVAHCGEKELLVPETTGVELNPELVEESRSAFAGHPQVKILQADFLTLDLPKFRYIIGNPPYVPITGISTEERNRYRPIFAGAVERFDLYTLFFERSLRLLAPGGRLCLITPEKFEYVHSAEPLRRILAGFTVESVDHLDESTFPGLVTYPTVTIVRNDAPSPETRTNVTFRTGRQRQVALPRDGSPWTPVLNPSVGAIESPVCLEDLCLRVSCGIATGADSLYVYPDSEVPPMLTRFAHPTVSGRQLGLNGPADVRTSSSMLVPYDRTGRLLPPSQLKDFLTFVSRPDISRRLKARTCVAAGVREWYRFHDNAPLEEILRPKILCKDIAQDPHFWLDPGGQIVPRHTVYYIVPKPAVDLNALLGYLNSDSATAWLRSNCQRAANGFYRLQSAVLKRLPVPEVLALSPALGRPPLGRSRGGPALRVPGQRQAILAAFGTSSPSE